MNFKMDNTDHLADWVREQPVPDGRDLEICAQALGTERFPREHDGFLRRRLAMLLDRRWAFDLGKGSVAARVETVVHCGECSMRDDRGDCTLMGKSTGDHAEDGTLHSLCPLRDGSFVLGLRKDASS